jgi:hypothetical protein
MAILVPRSTSLRIGFLDRERTVAGPNYSRWLVPPAALTIHLAIGQVCLERFQDSPDAGHWHY